MRRAWWALAGLALALLVSAGAVSAWAWRTLHAPYRGYAAEAADVEVEPGLDARAILELLERDGVLADARLTRIYLVQVLDDAPLKAGDYRFEGALNAPQVLDKLIRGEVRTHPVTLVEGLTLEETAQRLAEAGFGEYETLRALMQDPERIADLDPAAETLEGYLFPDTYSFARRTPEPAVVDVLVETFRRRFRDEVAPLLEAADERPVREIVTLASIVEKEARLADERPLIAGVFANRLRRGMPLQADPTVIYALTSLGRWDGNLRRPDLQVDSPYNTYRYPGLPPGPIASPGLASLQAAARPAGEPYLYFVSRNDGSHVFANTLAEHNRNVNRWQKEYWRRRWAEERRAAAAQRAAPKPEEEKAPPG